MGSGRRSRARRQGRRPRLRSARPRSPPWASRASLRRARTSPSSSITGWTATTSGRSCIWPRPRRRARAERGLCSPACVAARQAPAGRRVGASASLAEASGRREGVSGNREAGSVSQAGASVSLEEGLASRAFPPSRSTRRCPGGPARPVASGRLAVASLRRGLAVRCSRRVPPAAVDNHGLLAGDSDPDLPEGRDATAGPVAGLQRRAISQAAPPATVTYGRTAPGPPKSSAPIPSSTA